MAVRNLEAGQQLSGPAVRAESRPGRIGPISLGAKQTGERRAGNPHAVFDVAGIGNVALAIGPKLPRPSSTLPSATTHSRRPATRGPTPRPTRNRFYTPAAS